MCDLPSYIVQALMLINPDFWGLSDLERDKFKSSLSRDSLLGDVYEKAQLFIFSTILPGVDPESELSPDETQKVNLALQYLVGIGPNFFSFNEILEEGKSDFTYSTLYEFDIDYFNNQIIDRKSDTDEYKVIQYKGFMHSCWVRCIVDGHIKYPVLSMAGSYMADTVNCYALEHIDTLSTYNPLICPEANNADILKELRHRLYRQFGRDYWDQLNSQFFSEASTDVFLLTDEYSEQSDWNLIFSSPEALKLIRTRYFVDDIKLQLADSARYKDLIDNEKAQIQDWVDKEFILVSKEFRQIHDKKPDCYG